MIASGRPVPVIRPFVEAVGVNAPVLTMQGGMIYDIIPADDAPLALTEMARIAGDGATVVQSHRLFVEVNLLAIRTTTPRFNLRQQMS